MSVQSDRKHLIDEKNTENVLLRQSKKGEGETPAECGIVERIIVSGCDVVINGTYKHSGEEHGRPRFVHADSGDYKIVYDPSVDGPCPPFWLICHVEDDSMGLYHTNDETAAPDAYPPQTGWVCYHAHPPAPTISVVFSKIPPPKKKLKLHIRIPKAIPDES